MPVSCCCGTLEVQPCKNRLPVAIENIHTYFLAFDFNATANRWMGINLNYVLRFSMFWILIHTQTHITHAACSISCNPEWINVGCECTRKREFHAACQLNRASVPFSGRNTDLRWCWERKRWLWGGNVHRNRNYDYLFARKVVASTRMCTCLFSVWIHMNWLQNQNGKSLLRNGIVCRVDKLF